MCIVFLTTAHPDYALIVIDNRDEFILRPTSRPEWWRHPHGPDVLSARDLQRSEKGTWMGITKDGVFAVLTNYRETDLDDADHPIHAIRSRGGMVTYWLGTGAEEPAIDSIHSLVKDGGVKGVGGFSMLCGKLKMKRTAEGGRDIDPIAIVSNRASHIAHVPWVAKTRGEVCALSNIGYGDVDRWPKLEDGKQLLGEIITQAIKENLSEDQLVEKLFGLLDNDKLPRHEGMSLMDYVSELKQSIFIPAIGDEVHRKEMEECMALGKTGWPSGDSPAVEEALVIPTNGTTNDKAKVAENNLGFATGMYGTQRQTIILVDWDGQVTFRERALYDSHGNPILRGEADEEFRFKIEGWDDEDR
ncbi:hypothetical protein jhhlp_002749 [Lomentospora prolificans]|uniref:DUF833 domain-containing protein n=1 Tax=Lomentospora prolificans TaxID=41688 RepID=A0A2N3NEW9_9PEZI|nr:hypothetical protein jhhlp_002749 [Lomentospora prolificans]